MFNHIFKRTKYIWKDIVDVIVRAKEDLFAMPVIAYLCLYPVYALFRLFESYRSLR